MFLHNRNFRIASLVFVLFAFGFFYPGLSTAGVVETSMDFGEVAVGSTATGVLHITSLVPGLYAELAFGTCSCGTPFAIETTEVYIGTANTTVDVEVYFTPSSPGVCTTVLNVFYGWMDFEEIQVTGTGLGIVTQQTSTVSLLDYFDQAVEDGTLVGSGTGKSADNRLNALRNMIRVADDLVESGDVNGSCGKLQEIYKKIDGQDKPQDFAEGPGLTGLQDQVQLLMEGCK